ncbi:hypothetical protein [Roseibium denhamense]|uniref:Uncharacterized protein n=1 Tax=Roseibium denhamense TaxID=76305 RepID=A0ABY1NEC1_9HYPH|nr:hypothetical protein [Roseibium denhamense]SMP07164.1 hypothetical protein SAMN06265374_0842 [Roseibium denhamense]
MHTFTPRPKDLLSIQLSSQTVLGAEEIRELAEKIAQSVSADAPLSITSKNTRTGSAGR